MATALIIKIILMAVGAALIGRAVLRRVRPDGQHLDRRVSRRLRLLGAAAAVFLLAVASYPPSRTMGWPAWTTSTSEVIMLAAMFVAFASALTLGWAIPDEEERQRRGGEPRGRGHRDRVT